MTEPKNLNELMKETEKVVDSARDNKDSSGKLLEDTLPNLTRAGNETPGATTAEKKEEDSSLLSLDGLVGTAKGFGKGLVNLVVDTKKIFVNPDDATVRMAALRGDTSNTGFNLFSSVSKSGSEMSASVRQMLSNPGATFSGLANQLSNDYSKGSSEKKGEMVGEGIAFAFTLGVGTRALKGLGRLTKAEEAIAATRFVGEAGAIGREAALLREASLIGDATALGRLSGEARLLKAGQLGEGTAFLSGTAKAGERLTALTNGLKVTEVGQGVRAINLTEDLARLGKLETTVTGLGKTGVLSREMLMAERLSGAGRLGELAEGSALGRVTKVESTLAEMEVATRGLTSQTRLARELSLAGETGTVAGEVGALSKEAQLLSKEARAVEEAMTSVRMAQTDAARQVAMRELNASALRYNAAIDANAATAARSAELKISETALSQFESTAARTSEIVNASKLEGTASRMLVADRATIEFESKAQGLVTKLDDAKAVTYASKAEGAAAIEQKTLQIEQNMQRVRTAESAVAREQAMAELRTNVAQYNAMVDSSYATRAAELKISQKSLMEFETAAREASKTRMLATSEVTATNVTTRSQAITQQVERGRVALEGTEASAQYAERARQVEQSLEKARLAETSVAREKAISEFRASVQQYNSFVEANAGAKAAEIKIAQQGVSGFELSVREANYARVSVKADAAVTAATIQADLRGQAVLTELGKGRTAIAGVTTADAAAIEAKALKVEESVRLNQMARGSADMVFAKGELREAVQAYNEALTRTALTAKQAAQLRITESSLAQFEAAAREANHARRIAEVEVARGSEFMSRLSGRHEFLLGDRTSVFTGQPTGPLHTRADGLIEVSGQSGFRSRLRQIEERVGQVWDSVYQTGAMVKGLSRERALDLAIRGVGVYVIGRDLYLLYDRTVDRMYRLAAESAPAQGEKNQAGAPAGERQKAGDAGVPSGNKESVGAVGSDTRVGQADRAGAPADRQSVAGNDNNQGQVFRRSGSDELVLSPTLHQLRTPGFQATPTQSETTAAFVEMRRQEARKRRENQFGQDWFGNHVYLKAEPVVVESDRPAVPAAPPARKFGGSEPDVPRIVNPTFRPQVIYATQQELFGASPKGTSEARIAPSGTAESGRRVRGTSLKDEQKLTKLYPFLVAANGEAPIASGNKTVFKLAGVEGQEKSSMGKLTAGGGTQPAQPVLVSGGEPGSVAVMQAPANADPSGQQEEE